MSTPTGRNARPFLHGQEYAADTGAVETLHVGDIAELALTTASKERLS